MSETPRVAELSKHERHETRAETFYWCGQYADLARQLERELAQAQARCAELCGLLREVYGEFAKRHIRATDVQSRIDAALKEPR